MEENKTPEIGLKEVSEKLDTVLAAAAEAQAKAAAEAKAAKTADELEAVKNTHAVNFAPKGKDSAETKKDFRQFLTDVKAAKFGSVKAALQSGAVTGSYLVPAGFLPEVLDLLDEETSFISSARRLPWGIEGSTRTIPNLVSRSVWGTVGEGAQKPVSNPVFGEISQKLAKLAAIVVVTDELLADSSIDLPALFADQARAGLTDTLNAWLFKGNGDERPGILTASGVLTPTVESIKDLLALKQAVPSFVARTGKFYMDTAVYNRLAGLTRNETPNWLYYEEGKMRIDNSEVVPMDASLIGANNVVFGDLGNVLFSPKNDFTVRYSDTATLSDGETEHHLFQENKQAYLFEMRADITVIGSVWAKATVAA